MLATNKPDYAHIQTEKELVKLEKRIAKLYKEARDELEETVKAYFESFEKRDVEMKKLIGTIQNGKEWTEADYKQWRLNQMGRGERFEALRQLMAERYTKANEVAVSYVNDTTPGIYSLNRNYEAYTIETAGADCAFTLFDESTVRRLIVEAPDLMPTYPAEKALKRRIDLVYGKKQITSAVTSGILRGLSTGKIATELQNRISDMSRVSAVRTARTAITGAQNAGRHDANIAAKNMGINLREMWVASLDGRTRHDHARADGQIKEVDGYFIVGGEKLRFPGDHRGSGWNIYNCRCRTTRDIDSKDLRNTQRRVINPKTGESELIQYMTYDEWEAYHKATDPKSWDTFIKKGRNLSSDTKQFQEYKGILGKKVPNYLDEFQNLKYNEPEKWRMIKLDKIRRSELINHPELALPGEKKVLPEPKFTGYLFNPDNKRGWAKGQAFESRLGYNTNNWKDLRNEISRNKGKYPVLQKETDQYGTRYEQKMVLYGKTGNPTNVVVSWIVEESGTTRMTSAYIKEV